MNQFAAIFLQDLLGCEIALVISYKIEVARIGRKLITMIPIYYMLLEGNLLQ